MKVKYEMVADELISIAKGQKRKSDRLFEPSVYENIYSETRFSLYLLDMMDRKEGEDKVLLCRALVSLSAFNKDDYTYEEDIYRKAKESDSWSYGLCLLAGIGCKSDENGALTVLSEIDSAAGRFFGNLKDRGYSKDAGYVSKYFDLKQIATTNGTDELLKLIRESNDLFNREDLIGYGMTLASIIQILSRADSLDTHNKALSMLGNCPDSMFMAIYHISRSLILNRLFIRENMDVKERMQWDAAYGKLIDLSDRMRSIDDLSTFIVKIQKGEWDPIYLMRTDAPASIKLAILDSYAPAVIMIQQMGFIRPSCLDPLRSKSASLNLNEELDYESRCRLNELLDDMDPRAIFAAAHYRKKFPDESRYWLDMAARMDFTSAIEDVIRQNEDTRRTEALLKIIESRISASKYNILTKTTSNPYGDNVLNEHILLTHPFRLSVPGYAEEIAEFEEVFESEPYPVIRKSTKRSEEGENICNKCNRNNTKKEAFCIYCGSKLSK